MRKVKKGGSMNEEFRLLKDKVEHLQESIEFIAKRLNENMFVPKPRYSIGDRVYKCTTFMYYESGVVKEIGSYGKTYYGSKKPCWDCYVKWDYNSNYPKGNYSESWTCEENLFGSIAEYKDFLRERIEILVK